MTRPPLPGGIGVTHLRVYDTTAADGIRGGTPHLHTCCTEAYYVIAGEGEVRTLGRAGGAEVTALAPGVLAWFPPGTVHRLVNGSGDLEILVLMANSGLPEAGDMVLTFPDEVLADPDRYRAAAELPGDEATTEGSGAAARARRDLAAAGFGPLWDATVAGDPAPLDRFLERAVAIAGGRASGWADLVDAGPSSALDATRGQLAALAAGSTAGLADGGVHIRTAPAGPRAMGCCGTLGTYRP